MAMAETVIQETISSDEGLVSRIAWLYYRERLTQEEISSRLGIPRIKVSRLIERGHRLGIIQVQINSAFCDCLELESKVAKYFGLDDVRVIPSSSAGTNVTNENLGFEAGRYLTTILKEQALLAIGWGDTITRTLQKLNYFFLRDNISLVSLSGGVSAYLHGLTGFYTNQTKIHLIPAPILTSNPDLALAIRKEPRVREILAMVPMADCAIVGIGAAVDDATIVHSGYVTSEEIALYKRQGAVGDILGQFYDEAGKILDLPLHARITGTNLETLERIPRVIGIAGGLHKVNAIKGALAGGLVNVLITDESTATALVGRNGT